MDSAAFSMLMGLDVLVSALRVMSRRDFTPKTPPTAHHRTAQKT